MANEPAAVSARERDRTNGVIKGRYIDVSTAGMDATGRGLPSCPVACVPGELGREIKKGDALPEVPTACGLGRAPGRTIEREMVGRVFIRRPYQG